MRRRAHLSGNYAQESGNGGSELAINLTIWFKTISDGNGSVVIFDYPEPGCKSDQVSGTVQIQFAQDVCSVIGDCL